MSNFDDIERERQEKEARLKQAQDENRNESRLAQTHKNELIKLEERMAKQYKPMVASVLEDFGDAVYGSENKSQPKLLKAVFGPKKSWGMWWDKETHTYLIYEKSWRRSMASGYYVMIKSDGFLVGKFHREYSEYSDENGVRSGHYGRFANLSGPIKSDFAREHLIQTLKAVWRNGGRGGYYGQVDLSPTMWVG